jgi:hypothetical protein
MKLESTDGVAIFDERMANRRRMEVKIGIIPGMLAVWESHIAHLCHEKYMRGISKAK